jgi:hypothetical protein
MSLSADELYAIYNNLPFDELLETRVTSKENMSIIDSIIKNRHRAKFGPTDKSINKKIKDLKLFDVADKLSSVPFKELADVLHYGLPLLSKSPEYDPESHDKVYLLNTGYWWVDFITEHSIMILLKHY